MHRTPQRSYTPQSIESWFSRLNQDWERWFSEEELRWGRHFYRTGEIRSSELLEGSAIIHFKRGKEPLYVIVDWEGAAPAFRQSHPGFGTGRGLAVAGLYELEEFVADELPPLAELPDGASAARAAIDAGSGLEPQPPAEHSGRQLCARLLAREDGLWLEAGWKDAQRDADWACFAMRDLTRWEREQWIGYTARAHRCGFRPGDREGAYRLQDPSGIARFLREETREWKRRYNLTGDAALVSWRQGLREARPVIEVGGRGDAVSSAAGATGFFRMDFAAGGKAVSEVIRQRLFRQPGHVHFVPGAGLFQVDPRATGSIHEWKSILPADGAGELPLYLVYTFGRDPHVQLRLADAVEAWRGQLESAANLPPVELPGYLRTYQREGIQWLMKLESAGCHSLLADEMGLGKTLQILVFLDVREALGRKPVLVVCPASVVPVWQAEVKRFFPDTPVRVLSRTEPFDPAIPALWLSSYTQLRRNRHLLDGMRFEHVILDEAQSIKNPDAKVTHACLAIQARHRMVLTGTPMENRPLDLWTLFRFLMPGFLGTRRHFDELVKREDGFLERLRRQIMPFVLRRTKQAVAADLPPKIEIDWACPLTPVQRRSYEDLVAAAAGDLAGDMGQLMREQRMHVFSLLTRLRQACCDPALLPGRNDPWQHSGKLLSLVSRLEEAFAGGSKVVVFSQFVQFLRRARDCVKAEFPRVPQMELTGATLDRERPVQRFAEAEGAAVFFISLRAGGTGLNLQAADYVFLLDPWWNPAVEAQAIDRVHRLGQRQRVIVYRLITRGTIEERIERLKKEKGQLFADLLSDLDAPADLLQQFGSLRDLIALEGGDAESALE